MSRRCDQCEAITDLVDKLMGPLWCSLLERITPNCQQEDAYRRVMAGSDLALFSLLSGQSNSLAIAVSRKKYKLGAVLCFFLCLCWAMFFLLFLCPIAEHDFFQQ